LKEPEDLKELELELPKEHKEHKEPKEHKEHEEL
jgi:hypothetical protein